MHAADLVSTPISYTLSAKLPGFKTYLNADNYSDVGVTQRFNLVLQVGDVAEPVTVQSEVPVINTDTVQWSETNSGSLECPERR